jgi:hypothetical protein
MSKAARRAAAERKPDRRWHHVRCFRRRRRFDGAIRRTAIARKQAFENHALVLPPRHDQAMAACRQVWGMNMVEALLQVFDRSVTKAKCCRMNSG